MLASVIDAAEIRGVKTIHIPRAFMLADLNEKVYRRSEGEMMDLLHQLVPGEFNMFIAYSGNKS